MNGSNVVIYGHGTVGRGMNRIFPEAAVVDPDRGKHSYSADRTLAIICVPTPSRENGECDTSIVEDCISFILNPLILIKSTVSPGATDELSARFQKRIVFSPEYMGESEYWTPAQFPSPSNPISHGFMILGGAREDCAAIADIFLPRLGPATRFRFMPAREAELVKYAENTFFALKVTFANELRRICEAADVCYHTVREGWLDDPRVGPMHSAAFAGASGYGGKCFPKDVAALRAFCAALGIRSPLLEAVAAGAKP